MNVRWKKFFFKLTFWLAMEICLNLLGLDDIADYSEFVFERNLVVYSN